MRAKRAVLRISCTQFHVYSERWLLHDFNSSGKSAHRLLPPAADCYATVKTSRMADRGSSCPSNFVTDLTDPTDFFNFIERTTLPNIRNEIGEIEDLLSLLRPL